MLVLSRVAAGARERWMLCSEAECSGASGTMILIQFGSEICCRMTGIVIRFDDDSFRA